MKEMKKQNQTIIERNLNFIAWSVLEQLSRIAKDEFF